MKTLTCDRCGTQLNVYDMVDGILHGDGYHDAHNHVGRISIVFEKDSKMIDPPPDLCRKCVSIKVNEILNKK